MDYTYAALIEAYCELWREAVRKGRGNQIYDMTASEDRQTHLLLISIPHLFSVLRLPWM